eukprot:TRINITY_DN230_c0_g3_i1.p1 TRINITY_DN230_c0_g3~~TRINITY_DN230_c0_g3_i1.p1  ORF type:complete len:251 (-),score=76.27 TRINITY_DN230_c0_g3_i1:31-783(-)
MGAVQSSTSDAIQCIIADISLKITQKQIIRANQAVFPDYDKGKTPMQQSEEWKAKIRKNEKGKAGGRPEDVYEVVSEIRCKVSDTIFSIPVGFLFDGASVGASSDEFHEHCGVHIFALHDYLYTTHCTATQDGVVTFTKAQVDDIFGEELLGDVFELVLKGDRPTEAWTKSYTLQEMRLGKHCKCWEIQNETKQKHHHHHKHKEHSEHGNPKVDNEEKDEKGEKGEKEKETGEKTVLVVSEQGSSCCLIL